MPYVFHFLNDVKWRIGHNVCGIFSVFVEKKPISSFFSWAQSNSPNVGHFRPIIIFNIIRISILREFCMIEHLRVCVIKFCMIVHLRNFCMVNHLRVCTFIVRIFTLFRIFSLQIYKIHHNNCM